MSECELRILSGQQIFIFALEDKKICFNIHINPYLKCVGCLVMACKSEVLSYICTLHV